MNEMREVKCGECGGIATIVTGETVYPHRRDLYHLKFWKCECGAYVGCHRNSKDNKPMGSPAGEETRALRRKVHHRFDPMWKMGILSRTAAYSWFSALMGMEKEKCHVGMFTKEQCIKALDVLDNACTIDNPNGNKTRFVCE